MRILTTENTTFSMNEIPDEVDDVRYCVLDYSNQDEVDYYFMPLVFLESFSAPAAELRIGPHYIQMPLDWSVLIGEPHHGDLEVISLTALNDRGFQAFVFNPVDSFMPEYMPLEIVNVYPDIKWYFPKLKFGHILSVPLEDNEHPICAFFVKETSKIPDVLDMSKVV